MANSRSKLSYSNQKPPLKSASSRRVNSSTRRHSSHSSSPIPKQAKPPQLPKFRLIMVWIFLVGGMFGLAWRLYQLQIVQSTKLQKLARQQQTVNLRPYIPRRSIIDSQKNVLASDQLIYTLYAHPKVFNDPDDETLQGITDDKQRQTQLKEKIAVQLAGVLEDKTAPELLKRFNEQETGIKVTSGLTEATAEQIKKLGFDGLEVIEEYTRFYPQDDMASEIIGYVDFDHKGQAGLELSQKQILERDLLNLNIRRAGNGVIMPAFLPDGGMSFDDLQLELTIDLRLQRAARSALREQLKKFNAKRGAVIIMDAYDGSLLAMVCEPTFNPNRYYQADVKLFKNWTVSDLYEPGSTFKPLNVAIALDSGVIQANTYVYDSGSVTIDGWPIFNASKVGYGSINIAKVLQTSSNVGMIQIMTKLSKKDYYHRLQQLDLGENTGVDLPGEVAGRLKSEEEFTSKSIEAAVTSFGQGFSLTPIKLVQLHGALANGGKLVTPHIIKGLVDPDNRLHWQPNYQEKQIFSAKTTQQVVEMMEKVVSEGTGETAQISHYRIAGKTGTAQKAGPRGGYIPNAKITSFVAILPVDKPRYVVLAVVDEPQGANTFGSTVAAPIVKSVMEALISIQGIPPSKGATP
jgi:cell division protein FtsI (penicillin-binding protein 3)